ncbi:F-BAR domain only protein 2 [Larimichthys crocea]|uniref:Uncharacterized protein n=1 Tax=Larimichthys crocea TaxID=215358 RepID=A0ACD3QPU2_LARCR|nr:F-BAR domain only protein 2 [Larimichthys crocea]
MAKMSMVDQSLLQMHLEAMQAVRTRLLEKAYAGEKNNGFDVLYHNMKHGQISSKELTDFIRERSTIEEAYARSMTKLAKSAGNFSQLGTFAPVWEVFKSSTEKLASCHMELVRKLQELIKEVQKYVEEQAKAHKKTKEEVASTLEAVQNIQTTSQALQKSKEIYNAKTVEQERLRKEGATQRDVDKAGVKAKKATETYKSYVEKYATAKSEFEQKMAETAQLLSADPAAVVLLSSIDGDAAPPDSVSGLRLQLGRQVGKNAERQATAGYSAPQILPLSRRWAVLLPVPE